MTFIEGLRLFFFRHGYDKSNDKTESNKKEQIRQEVLPQMFEKVSRSLKYDSKIFLSTNIYSASGLDSTIPGNHVSLSDLVDQKLSILRHSFLV